MEWLWGLLAFVVIGAIIRLIDRGGNTSTPAAPYVQTNKDEYFSDAGYRYSRKHAENVSDMAALAEQHKSGRHTDINGEVYVNMGHNALVTDNDMLGYLRWLDKFGARNGVIMHAMNGDQEMTAAEKHQALYPKGKRQ